MKISSQPDDHSEKLSAGGFRFGSREQWRQAALKIGLPPARLIAADPAAERYGHGWPSVASPGARRLQMFTRGLQPLVSLLPFEGEDLRLPLGSEGKDVLFSAWILELLDNAFEPSTGPLLSFPEQDMDQRIVEASALAEWLVGHRTHLWDPLSPQVQERYLDWFEACLARFTLSINNWNLFAVQIAVALEHLGREAPVEGVCRLLEDVEEMYKGDGWYADGYYRQFDQYVPAEIIPMLLFTAEHGRGEIRDAALPAVERAARFAEDFQYFTDVDGHQLAYGRSLAYRMGGARFWAAAALHHVPGIEPGLCRDRLTRNLEQVFSWPVFDEDGLFVPGFGYHQQALPELYVDAGSQYGAAYVFGVLSLPESDPFWLAEPESPDVDRGQVIELKAANSRAIVESGGQNVTLLNGGIQHPFHFPHQPAKYGKFAYNSHFGFNLHLDGQWGADHALLVSLDGVSWTHPFHFEVGGTEDGWFRSRRRPLGGWEGVCVSTSMKQNGDWLVFLHALVNTVPVWLRQGGTPVEVELDAEIWSETENPEEGVKGDNGSACILGLEGPWSPVGAFAQIGANILHERTLIPAVEAEFAPGTHTLCLAAWHFTEIGSVPEARPGMIINEENRIIEWPNGDREKVNVPAADTSPLKLDSGKGKPFEW